MSASVEVCQVLAGTDGTSCSGVPSSRVVSIPKAFVAFRCVVELEGSGDPETYPKVKDAPGGCGGVVTVNDGLDHGCSVFALRLLRIGEPAGRPLEDPSGVVSLIFFYLIITRDCIDTRLTSYQPTPAHAMHASSDVPNPGHPLEI